MCISKKLMLTWYGTRIYFFLNKFVKIWFFVWVWESESWISNYRHYEVWDEIDCPFLNYNNVIPHLDVWLLSITLIYIMCVYVACHSVFMRIEIRNWLSTNILCFISVCTPWCFGAYELCIISVLGYTKIFKFDKDCCIYLQQWI